MFRKACAIIAIILGAGFLRAPEAFALNPGDIVMSLNPSEVELELAPGKTFESSVGVSNVGRLPFDVRASVSPYYVNPDDYTPNFSADASYTKLHNWVTVEKDTYHLEPGETATVNFTVKVPDNVAGGGQYAAIMLLSDSGIEEEGAVKVQGQLAAIIYGHVNGGETIKSGELISHLLPSFMFNDSISVSQTVTNSGNVDFRVKQTMTITDFFTNQDVVTPDSVSSDGQMIGYNVATVLPDTSRTGVLTWTDAPKLGLFNVTQEISFLDQAFTFSQIVLICPIWLVALALVAVLALIIRVIYVVKSRRQSPRRAADPDESD